MKTQKCPEMGLVIECKSPQRKNDSRLISLNVPKGHSSCISEIVLKLQLKKKKNQTVC